MTPRQKAISWLAAGLVAAAALAGHWLFWYQPRLRPATPGADLPSRLLVDPEFAQQYETAVWIAHPHQNLPVLSEMTGLHREAFAEALRLLGLEGAELGGARLPPASSLALAVSGGDFVAAARVHPLAAGFLRLSGALAGNPWLGGGTVVSGTVVSGTVVSGGSAAASRKIEISWQGATWTARTGPAPGPGSRPLKDPLPTNHGIRGWTPAVAWVRHGGRSTVSSLPLAGPLAGRGRLVASPGHIEFSSPEADAGDPRLAQGRHVLEAADALVLLLQRDGLEAASPAQSLLLLPLPESLGDDELPRSAVLFRGPAETAGAWQLPGEGLLEIAGREPPRGRWQAWRIRATDAVGLGRATAAARELEAMARESDLPSWGLWLRVAPAAEEVGRVARSLEASPFLPREDRRRWLAAAAVLGAMAERPARLEAVVDPAESGRWLVRWQRQEP